MEHFQAGAGQGTAGQGDKTSRNCLPTQSLPFLFDPALVFSFLSLSQLLQPILAFSFSEFQSHHFEKGWKEGSAFLHTCCSACLCYITNYPKLEWLKAVNSLLCIPWFYGPGILANLSWKILLLLLASIKATQGFGLADGWCVRP